MSKKDDQSISSFNEQKCAISICKKTVDAYASLSNTFSKSLCICDFPCAGKTWSMLVIAIYTICRGLIVSMIAMMTKQAIQLGGEH